MSFAGIAMQDSLADEVFAPKFRIPKSEIDKCQLGYCTPSAGADCSHDLKSKLKAIASAGFTHVEMGYPDLVQFAEQQLGSSFKGEKDYDSLVEVSKGVHTYCAELGLYISTLMPFGPYGGYTADEDREEALERAEGWFRVIQALGNPMLQCGTSNEASSTLNVEQHVRDLQRLADRAAKKGIKIAYEQWCWAKTLKTWQHSWEVVKKADRPNLGLCLDTFQIAGIDYADPTTASGLNEKAVPNPVDHLSKSLEQLEKLDSTKIFYLQISSATRMIPPLGPAHPNWQDGVEARFQWSDSFRPMPFSPERGSYLPVMPVVEAVLKTGFRGLFSCETFDMEVMKNADPDTPTHLTTQAYSILHNKVLGAFVD